PRHPDEGPDQHVVDVLGEHEAQREHQAEGEHRLDQARAQFDEVIEQRRLARLDLVFVFFSAHAPPPACFAGSLAGSSAGGSAAASSWAMATGCSGGGSSACGRASDTAGASVVVPAVGSTGPSSAG